MSDAGARPIAPSSRLALYLAAIITVYLAPGPRLGLGVGLVFIAAALAVIRSAPRPVPTQRWRAAIVFVVWVFLMRAALDLVTGVPVTDTVTWLIAARQAARVGVIAFGVIALIASTAPREVVDELETSRLPRALRMLVMMTIQYPRVLRERFDQIVEAQVARGAERPRTVAQRVGHGASLLLPVMQSELDAVGERAALIHLRGLDVEGRPGSEEASASTRGGLRFAGYGFTYSGAPKPALHDLTLDVGPGRIVAVLAGQGTGKTTLLRAAAGLLGEIYQGSGTGTIDRPGPERPGAFFDGSVQVTLAVETVREEIALPLHESMVAADARRARVQSVARDLGIEHLLDRDVTALSGGEEKLVGIAAALAPDTGIHLLDEPFEQLDVAHIAAVIRALKLRARAGKLVLVASGSVDTALNIADEAIVFDGAGWRLIAAPTYADVSGLPGLGRSSVGEFLRRRSVPDTGVRRFRDGVLRAS